MREEVRGLRHRNTFEEELEITKKDFPVKTPDTIALQLWNSLEMSKQISTDLEETQKKFLSEQNRENKIQNVAVTSHVPVAELRQIFEAALPRPAQAAPDPVRGVREHEEMSARLRAEAQMEALYGGMREIYNQNQLIRQAQDGMQTTMQHDALHQIVHYRGGDTLVQQRGGDVNQRAGDVYNNIAHHVHVHNENLAQQFYQTNQTQVNQVMQMNQFDQHNQINNTLLQQLVGIVHRDGDGGDDGDGGGYGPERRGRIGPYRQLALPTPPVPKAAVPDPRAPGDAIVVAPAARSKASPTGPPATRSKASPTGPPFGARSKAKAKPGPRHRSRSREQASSSSGPSVYYIGDA